jgi:hypothetical protein
MPGTIPQLADVVSGESTARNGYPPPPAPCSPALELLRNAFLATTGLVLDVDGLVSVARLLASLLDSPLLGVLRYEEVVV